MYIIILKNNFFIYLSKYEMAIVSGLKVITFQSARVESISPPPHDIESTKKPGSNKVK